MSKAEKEKKAPKQVEGIELLLSSHIGYRQNGADSRERKRTEEEQAEFWTEFWGPQGRLRSVYTPGKETLA